MLLDGPESGWRSSVWRVAVVAVRKGDGFIRRHAGRWRPGDELTAWYCNDYPALDPLSVASGESSVAGFDLPLGFDTQESELEHQPTKDDGMDVTLLVGPHVAVVDGQRVSDERDVEWDSLRRHVPMSEK